MIWLHRQAKCFSLSLMVACMERFPMLICLEVYRGAWVLSRPVDFWMQVRGTLQCQAKCFSLSLMKAYLEVHL